MTSTSTVVFQDSNAWKQRFLASLYQAGYVPEGTGIYVSLHENHDTEHNPCPNIDYLSRMSEPMSTTAGEWPYYSQAIHYATRLLPEKGVALDLGCGDGRVTLELLRTSSLNVISVDIDHANMLRVTQRIGTDQKPRWLGWVGDAKTLDLPMESLDAVCVMGLLHVLLPEVASLLRSLYGFLRTGGLLINSEATVEGALLYAIARRSIQEFQRVASSQTKTVDFDNPSAPRVPVVSSSHMQGLLESAGFQIVHRVPVSVIPSLLYGAWFREESLSETERRGIHEIVHMLRKSEVNAARVEIFISRKG